MLLSRTVLTCYCKRAGGGTEEDLRCTETEGSVLKVLPGIGHVKLEAKDLVFIKV